MNQINCEVKSCIGERRRRKEIEQWHKDEVLAGVEE